MPVEQRDRMTADSDLVAVGRSGLITSTGGSTNVEVELQQVLKGPPEPGTIRVAFSTMGPDAAGELVSGQLYIFFLQALRNENVPVYRLSGDAHQAVVPFSDEELQLTRDSISRTKPASA